MANQRSVAARVKTQHTVPGKLRYKEKQKRAEQVEHDLETKTLFQGGPILCTEELGGIDVYAGVDAEGNRAKQHVQLRGNGDRTHAARVAYHDGVHKAGALVENLLPGDGQSNAPDLSVKGGGRGIGILPFFQQSSHFCYSIPLIFKMQPQAREKTQFALWEKHEGLNAVQRIPPES